MISGFDELCQSINKDRFIFNEYDEDDEDYEMESND